MRCDIVSPLAGSLKYEIREIVLLANEFKRLGMDMTWENIGDPVAKGELPPQWIRDTVVGLQQNPRVWGYCDTAGVPETRTFLAEHVNKRGGVQITADDILFFNGLGDAVNKVYGLLKREARILGPTPAYSTHPSGDSMHSGYPQFTYDLDPSNGWLPDVDDIRMKVKYNDSIAGIVLISPDNPTGAVYPKEVLEAIAEIARQNGLFVICDEIYIHILYRHQPRWHCSEWIGDVPAIAMRGISKEYPWPGARCGWLEVLNRDKDANFDAYASSLLAAKRLEVCCTTLPQMSIPPVMGDSRYPGHLRDQEDKFNSRAQQAVDAFAGCEYVMANKPGGAFYFTVVFKPGVLNDRQTLPIANPKVKARVEGLVGSVPADKRFVYYLMGATGIVTVPLSGFNSSREGFRITLLETDDTKRAWIYKTLRDSIEQYVKS